MEKGPSAELAPGKHRTSRRAPHQPEPQTLKAIGVLPRGLRNRAIRLATGQGMPGTVRGCRREEGVCPGALRGSAALLAPGSQTLASRIGRTRFCHFKPPGLSKPCGLWYFVTAAPRKIPALLETVQVIKIRASLGNITARGSLRSCVG